MIYGLVEWRSWPIVVYSTRGFKRVVVRLGENPKRKKEILETVIDLVCNGGVIMISFLDHKPLEIIYDF